MHMPFGDAELPRDIAQRDGRIPFLRAPKTQTGRVAAPSRATPMIDAILDIGDERLLAALKHGADIAAARAASPGEEAAAQNIGSPRERSSS